MTNRLFRLPMPRGAEEILEIEKQHLISDLLRGDDIYDFLEASASAAPDKAAIVAVEDPTLETPPLEISYKMFLARVTQAANLFHSIGVKKEDAVAVLLPILPETQYAIWGASTAAIANPINPFLDINNIAGVMKAAKAKVLIAPGSDIDPQTAEKAEALRDLVPGLSHFYYVGAKPHVGSLSFTDALETQAGDALFFDRKPSLEKTAAYFHTGGTTGQPKLARHSHLGQVLNGFFFGLINGNEADCAIAQGMPMFHVGGSVVMSLRAFIHGQTCVHMTPHGFRTPAVVQNFWKIVEAYQITSIMAVPTVCAALLNNTKAPGKTSMEFVATGAATVPEELASAFYEKFGIHMREVWGMTELHGVATSNLGHGAPVIGSAGIRMPFHQMKVIEETDGKFLRECDTNEAGLIVFNGPTVIDGYVDAKHTRTSFIEGMPDGKRWLNTGDLGRIDDKGYIWIIGRAKDLIIRGGHNIDPVIIEDALLAHPAVALAAAVGRPDGLKGEMPVAYVQLKPAETADANDLESFTADHIPERAAIPEQIIILDAIPITAVGKIFKPALRTDITERTVNKIIADFDIADVETSVAARFDKSKGLTVAVTLTGNQSTCSDVLKVKIEETLGPYPFVLEIAE